MNKIPFANTVKEFWGSLSNAQRFITALFVSLSLVVLGVVSIVATRPQNAILFSGLQPEDSGAIVSKLQEKKIPYEIDGTAIKVPESKVHELRMDLASQGLPQGGTVGFEIFDKSNFGMTEFTQRLNKQRALQGELGRTLKELDGVLEARVHIATPEPSVYSEKEEPATASVVLKLRVGRNLDGGQVAGITHLVSSAVEGLKPNAVTVMDTNGNVLSEGTDDTTGLDPRLSAAQLRLKRDHEVTIERNIQSMLEHVLGPGKAIVRVSAEMNFDRTETDSEEFEPAGTGPERTGVLSAEESSTETYKGNGDQSASSPLRATNVRGGPGDYTRDDKTRTYQVGKTVRHIIQTAGKVERLSVAVMVDDKVDALKRDAIRQAVTAAAGINTTKGDTITVASIAFDDSAKKKEDQELQVAQRQDLYMSLGKTIGGVALLAVFLFVLGRMLNPRPKKQLALPEPIVAGAVGPGEAAPQLDMIIPPTFTPMIEEMKAPVSVGVTNKVKDVAQTEPEEIADVIRKWMAEG